MADFEINNPTTFTENIRKFETTDEGHADIFNCVTSELVNNDAYLKENKVDKEKGKSLSENNYTNADKNKLFGIEEGAEVNVQSDWNVTDSNSDAYIKNKPQSMKNPNSLTISLNGVSQGEYDGSVQRNVNITAERVGADSSGTAKSKVSEHNVSENSHIDIRELVTELANRLKVLNKWSQKIDDRFNDNAAFMAERLVTSEGENVNAGLNVGSLSRPVYFSNGLPVMCDEIITTRIFDSYEITRNPSLNKGSIPVAQNSSYIKLSSGILIVGVNLTLGNAHFEYNCMFPISFINSRYVAVLTENVGNKPEEVNHKNATITRTYNNYCVIKHDGGDTGSSYIGFDEYNEAFDYASVICIGRWK